MDVIFDLSTSTTRVIGPMTRPETFLLRGTCDVFGIRFRPGGLSPFLDAAAHELRDLAPTAAEVSPESRRFAELRERLQACPSEARFGLALEVVGGWVGTAREDPIVRRADRLVRTSDGRADVAGIAQALGVSTRGLERRYRRHAGIPPKLALRIERFRRARAVLDDQPRTPLATVAFRCGYADQAHFTRDFTELAGETPARWRAGPAGVAFVQDTGGPTA
jgi:AraC-like DNA-binding protein